MCPSFYDAHDKGQWVSNTCVAVLNFRVALGALLDPQEGFWHIKLAKGVYTLLFVLVEFIWMC
jgi:hypothetical protein